VRSGAGERRLDEMASEPRLWLGLRRLDALALVLCALALGGASATASAAPVAAASEPSAAGAELAWQQLGGPGELRNSAGAVSALPGLHPALGGSMIAWASAGSVTVADRASLTPRLTLTVAGVNALAVSDTWLVYRQQDASGAERLVGVSLTAPGQTRYVFGAQLAGEVGRPSLQAARVVFAIGTPSASAIEALDLTSGGAGLLRIARHGVSLSNPSLLGGQLLFVRTTRCVQQLRLGAAVEPGRRRARERTLLSLPSAVHRDTGYERRFTHAYNSASRCPNRPAGRGGSVLLGTTSLAGHGAFVTEYAPATGDARIVGLRR
jgi:hypothetical protein